MDVYSVFCGRGSGTQSEGSRTGQREKLKLGTIP
jgi:hypothetical protein